MSENSSASGSISMKFRRTTLATSAMKLELEVGPWSMGHRLVPSSSTMRSRLRVTPILMSNMYIDLLYVYILGLHMYNICIIYYICIFAKVDVSLLESSIAPGAHEGRKVMVQRRPFALRQRRLCRHRCRGELRRSPTKGIAKHSFSLSLSFQLYINYIYTVMITSITTRL